MNAARDVNLRTTSAGESLLEPSGESLCDCSHPCVGAASSYTIPSAVDPSWGGNGLLLHGNS